MLKGFKNFVMRGDIVTVAVGLVIALALSTLIKAFTDFVINPIITRAQGGRSMGLGWQLGKPGNRSTYLDLGSFLSAVIYFLIFMAVVYFCVVMPYKHVQARRGQVVFEEPGALKTCPACLSEDLPEAASKCLHCASDQPPAGPARTV
ncbi:mechanosensitive ion channel protein MscL [Streptomyces albireticuli]|uniref:Mechanosensitive ion channel protein MscL n=1 Tax=Streptomyces albireticuli TaxID=1940 RepID=A0A1Z2LAZ8_9ACTN|nr:MscL family protein [Streptomyces albireticuli]ARZ71401.1 mechanosensitive ion channel protein MscL [Streptomyces albireticuli]